MYFPQILDAGRHNVDFFLLQDKGDQGDVVCEISRLDVVPEKQAGLVQAAVPTHILKKAPAEQAQVSFRVFEAGFISYHLGSLNNTGYVNFHGASQ
jgi:hypothetical protein